MAVVLLVVVEFVDGVAETFGFVSDEELFKPGAVSKPRFETTGAGEFLKQKEYKIKNFQKLKMCHISKTTFVKCGSV